MLMPKRYKRKIPVTLEIEKVSKHVSHFDFEEVADDIPNVGYFRYPTKEEADSVNRYINSISSQTGVNFYDIER